MEGELERRTRSQPGSSSGNIKPTTLNDILALQENQGASLVVPLPWCPHLKNIPKSPRLKDTVINTDTPCSDCENVGENWYCLYCEAVYCGRYVQEHALFHGLEKEHPLTLSFSDLSVWCYVCDSYVDNEILYSFKNRVIATNLMKK
ncbi:unnamed protein product [Lepeophtheirus salmonis]|uniref:(salmon louse) hypothetical protein n=1 Tax=Lepeophtheirus salmonis TaxID=72036 RepID=A0A7R8CD37_LEPSM|nr:unnamed protein product [Lepeophtheirus salmonis]CAF2775659.1 unnamed protein product [Lepeophtheirus salmonis]